LNDNLKYIIENDSFSTLLTVENDDWCFVDYVCVLKEFRGKGIGTTILQKLLDRCKESGKFIFLEVDTPKSKFDNESLNRIRFVEF
jgi:GNAT superfamily N-acetyltransferase